MDESQDKILKECYNCKRILFIVADKYTEGKYICDRCSASSDSKAASEVEGVAVKSID